MKKDLNSYDYAFLVSMLGFILFKASHLNIPFFWDESWVYGPAIQIMADDGPGLLPSAMHEWISRGHPLLFHFLGGSWITIFGKSLISIHLFPLTFSIAFLTGIYLYGRNRYAPSIGFTAFLFILIQPAFLAQSAMVLPEVMLALWVFASVASYLSQKKSAYVVFATFALYTKESALVFVLGIILWEFLQILMISTRRSNFFSEIGRSLYLLLPLVLIALFFVVQYFQKGWFFYPEHTGMIDLSSYQVKHKLGIYFEYLFFKNGNLVISLLLVISLGYIAVRKRSFYQKHGKELLFLFYLIVAFSIFSAINFFTSRYLMSVFPFFTLMVALSLHGIKPQRWMQYSSYAIIVAISLSFSLLPSKSHQGDTNMGYLDGIKVHQAAIDYLVENDFQDRKIYTHFLMINQLKNYRCRYLEKDEVFPEVHNNLSESIDLIVYSSFEREFDIQQIQEEHPFERIFRYEHGKAFTEIYERVESSSK